MKSTKLLTVFHLVYHFSTFLYSWIVFNEHVSTFKIPQFSSDTALICQSFVVT